MPLKNSVTKDEYIKVANLLVVKTPPSFMEVVPYFQPLLLLVFSHIMY